MKSNQKIENHASEFPVFIDFLDFGTVEEVVEAALIKETKKRRRKA
jgi:hypothetical protein